MNKNKDFMEFCNNKYSREFLKSFCNITNYTASCYLNSCDILAQKITNGLKDADDDTSSGKISENKVNLCMEAIQQHAELTARTSCILQRVAVLCGALLTEQINLRQTQADTYLRSFASDCRRILGDRCKINVIPGENFIFNSFKDLLDIIMLRFIRTACYSIADSDVEDPGLPSFDLSAHIKNGIPEITINTDAHIENTVSDNIDTMDFFETCSAEIIETLAGKLGLETETGSSHLTIKFPANIAGTDIIAEQPQKQLINEGNSVFRIMLGDL